MIKCPVCCEYDFKDDNDFDICDICGWENDGVQFDDPDYWGGANDLSLNEYKIEYKLLQSEATHEKASEAVKIHGDIRAQIYIKYKGIDYRVDGDKIYKELNNEHSRYVNVLNELEQQIIGGTNK